MTNGPRAIFGAIGQPRPEVGNVLCPAAVSLCFSSLAVVLRVSHWKNDAAARGIVLVPRPFDLATITRNEFRIYIYVLSFSGPQSPPKLVASHSTTNCDKGY